MLAAGKGHEAVVRYLLSIRIATATASCIDAPNNDGNTALCLAALSLGSLAELQLLIGSRSQSHGQQ